MIPKVAPYRVTCPALNETRVIEAPTPLLARLIARDQWPACWSFGLDIRRLQRRPTGAELVRLHDRAMRRLRALEVTA